ncbi:hypothetical protein CXB51_028738 [Gossypium anomalum]|uniref:Aminotransferase-like plant mobile domain-containing protein n=1 Tax=Gossypium anomalum TaxID=47600 RepID=A0A8J5YAY7_9ROSI|nr:hypothetical protein CXB51_028738 [Gossypium anomalum]
MQLQLGLLVDGYAVTGSAQSADWGPVCYELLERIRYAQAYILEMIGGYLMPNFSRNRVHLRWLLKLIDFRAAGELSWGSAVLATLYREMCEATRPNKAKIGGCLSLLQSWARFCSPLLRPRVNHPYTFPLITSYVGIPTSLEDIRLLLDQRSEAQFQWTPYEDPTIRAVIPDEFFQNRNIWHVKVPLVNYAIVEMHQEPIIVPELACVPEYMPWFRIYSKPYLLSEEERRRQIRVQKERRGPLNPRRRDDDAGQSTAPTQSPGPSTAPTQPPGPTLQSTTPISHPFQIMPDAYPSPYMYPNPFMFPFPNPIAGWNAWPSLSLFLITSSQSPISRPLSHEGSQEALGALLFTNPHCLMGFKHLRTHYFIKVGHPPNTHNQIPYRRNHNLHWSKHNPRRKLNQGGI